MSLSVEICIPDYLNSQECVIFADAALVCVKFSTVVIIYKIISNAANSVTY